MRLLLVFCLLFASNLFAQGVLVAWELGQAPTVIELVATKNLPVEQVTGEPLGRLPSAGYELYLYQVPDRQQRLTLMRELRAKKTVRFVELDAEVLIQNYPLAPSHFKQLNLVDASEQPIQYPCESYPIAIIDTGINTYHPSLITTNFDFQKNYLSKQQGMSAEDDDGHGTHVAGLIAALVTPVTNNLGHNFASVAGICSSITLHNMKALPKNSGGNISDVYTALKDALDKGRDDFPIINASIQTSRGLSLEAIVTELNKQGQFIVAAAGNEGKAKVSYPAAYSHSLPLVISVANIGKNNALAKTSNYGYQLVDFAAPGERLLSTWLNASKSNQAFKEASGTSMSAPLVSATLSALMQKYQYFNLPPEAFRAALINSLTFNPELIGKLSYSGFLNTREALELSPETLFKPTWFNFEWVENSNSIYLKGYNLNEVDKVVFYNKKEGVSSRLLDFSYDNDKKALLINLTEDWDFGYLKLTSNSQDLAELDFTLMVNESLPNHLIACESDHCSLRWQDYQLDITRQDGHQASDWWLASRFEEGKELLIITGFDLSADWNFKFSGQPRLNLAAMQVNKKNKGLQNLTPADGYKVDSNGTSANWYLDNPEEWSYIKPPLQQLVLLPEVKKDIYYGSSECYIATAVYGDNYAPEVIKLRKFRDEFLIKFYLGRKFINFYYSYSPDFVEWAADKPNLQKLIAWWLTIFVSFLD